MEGFSIVYLENRIVISYQDDGVIQHVVEFEDDPSLDDLASGLHVLADALRPAKVAGSA